jgi:hypothetical protein
MLRIITELYGVIRRKTELLLPDPFVVGIHADETGVAQVVFHAIIINGLPATVAETLFPPCF